MKLTKAESKLEWINRGVLGGYLTQPEVKTLLSLGYKSTDGWRLNFIDDEIKSGQIKSNWYYFNAPKNCNIPKTFKTKR